MEKSVDIFATFSKIRFRNKNNYVKKILFLLNDCLARQHQAEGLAMVDKVGPRSDDDDDDDDDDNDDDDDDDDNNNMWRRLFASLVFKFHFKCLNSKRTNFRFFTAEDKPDKAEKIYKTYFEKMTD